MNEKLAMKLAAMAVSLEAPIEAAFSDRLENTPKRQKEACVARLKGYQMRRARDGAKALSILHQTGGVPESLTDVKTKKELLELACFKMERSGAYYDVGRELREPALDTDKARDFWALLTPKSDEEKTADLLRRKVGDLKFAKIAGYFPTPRAIVERMIDRANISEGAEVLDPQAGSGGILDVVRELHPSSIVSAVEINPSLCDILKLKGYPVRETDFLHMVEKIESSVVGIDPIHQVEAVLMNPPFERGQDMDHVMAAYKLVADGGRLVAIMSPSFLFKQDKKTTAFKAWLDDLPHYSKKMPSGSFKESGTGVETTMLVIEKPHN